MVLTGKSLYEKSVCVSLRHRKYSIMFTFDSSEEAREYYDSFDYENEKLTYKRFLINLCKHKNMHDLNIGYKSHHYEYCPDCNRAIYVDDETKEDKKERYRNLSIRIKERDILDLKDEIREMKERIHRGEISLLKLEAELASELEEQNKGT